MEYVLGFLFIYVLYKLITASRKTYKEEYKVERMSAFDAYLIDHHKKSLVEAEKIPVVVPYVPSPMEDKPLHNNTWVDDLYLGMIKSEQYDTNALRKEAMDAMNVTEKQLDELLEQYKLDKKKQR